LELEVTFDDPKTFAKPFTLHMDKTLTRFQRRRHALIRMATGKDEKAVRKGGLPNQPALGQSGHP
jgi:hypothetical protein